MANKPWRMWIWAPGILNWWVAILFMIGAALFALGCVLFLCKFQNEFALDSVFFAGSLFFTSAAYCQLHQTSPAKKIAYWSALSQFVGTLMFNINTFDAFFNLDWIEQHLLVWAPNIFGSILFLISGSLAMFDICKKCWCWHFDSVTWWIGCINYAGCVAFLASAILAFTIPSPISNFMVTGATIFTLVGACCFFCGAFLMWPEMILRRGIVDSASA